MIDFLLEQVGLRRISKILPPAAIKGKSLHIEIREGANGRWRWFAYEESTFLASGHPQGYDTRAGARMAAIDLLKWGNTFHDIVHMPKEGT